MAHSAYQNLFVDPWHYYAPLENHRELTRNAQLATSAWSQVVATHPGPFSPDYASGFKEGYVDFLYSGDAGAPSPLPPRRYWGTAYQTPAGRQAIADYFAGFRHGAAAAQASGQRELVTLPINVAAAAPVADGHEWSSPVMASPGPGSGELVPTPAPNPPFGPGPAPSEALPPLNGPGFSSQNKQTGVPVAWSSRNARPSSSMSPTVERLPSVQHEFR